jgi:hypothetical protein
MKLFSALAVLALSAVYATGKAAPILRVVVEVSSLPKAAAHELMTQGLNGKQRLEGITKHKVAG